MHEKKWPENCVWPRPRWDLADKLSHSNIPIRNSKDVQKYFNEDYPKIKEYMDEQVRIGRLNPDYTLNKNYYNIYIQNHTCKTPEESKELKLLQLEQDEECEYEWRPEIGDGFWDGKFLIENYESAPADFANLHKISVNDAGNDPVSYLSSITGYKFQNENLLRQAFTRKAFKEEYHLTWCSEQFEFLGNAVLNAMVTKEIVKQNILNLPEYVDGVAWLNTGRDKGYMTKLRTQYVNKEFLAERATTLGFDRFILYGKGEKKSQNSRGDIIEAIIGAVAFDCNWDWSTLEKVVFNLINFCIPPLGHECYFDEMNKWHQKHFGKIPEYKVFQKNKPDDTECFECVIRFSLPENDKGIETIQEKVGKEGSTRSLAKENAAKKAVDFLKEIGLWLVLKNINIEPRVEDAINQLQELYQKKYIDKPEYEFVRIAKVWACECKYNGIQNFAYSKNKTDAKKKAAFYSLTEFIMKSGLEYDKWFSMMLDLIEEERPLRECILEYDRKNSKTED